MKKFAGCAVVMLVPFVVLFAVLWFVLATPDDASSLTQEVDVTVAGSRDLGQTMSVDYAYRVDGEWYADSETFDQFYWQPGKPIRGCVDPEDVTRHAVTVTPGERCGDPSLSSGVHTAEPTSAPSS